MQKLMAPLLRKALADPLPDQLRRFDSGIERAANPEHPLTDKVTQCTDELGLYLEGPSERVETVALLISQHGQAEAAGPWPLSDVGPAEARKRRDDARGQLGTGTDTLAERKHEKLVAVFKAASTFGDSASGSSERFISQFTQGFCYSMPADAHQCPTLSRTALAIRSGMTSMPSRSG
jgi:hypothetical protein